MQHGVPLCFANAGRGFNLTLEEVEGMLDHLVATEGTPEVVQFSGGEPSIHPQIVPMMRAAKARNIRYVMLNTNGKRIADDDTFLAELADIRPSIYFQFDGFASETYRFCVVSLTFSSRRCAPWIAGSHRSVRMLVPAIERGVNLHEVGAIVHLPSGIPPCAAINFQPAFHAGRYDEHDPLQRLTIPTFSRR